MRVCHTQQERQEFQTTVDALMLENDQLRQELNQLRSSDDSRCAFCQRPYIQDTALSSLSTLQQQVRNCYHHLNCCCLKQLFYWV